MKMNENCVPNYLLLFANPSLPHECDDQGATSQHISFKDMRATHCTFMVLKVGVGCHMQPVKREERQLSQQP